jgi:RecB family exonuclease
MSPTAINTYFSCPRKFYFRYVRKVPTRPSIYLIRGQIVHKTLRRFHDTALKTGTLDSLPAIKSALLDIFSTEWKGHEKALQSLNLSPERLLFFHDDSQKMLSNFSTWFYKEGNPAPDFTELRIFSRTLRLMGIIDAVITPGENTVLVDYKTSSNPSITDDILRQAALYALLYEDRYKDAPEAVWIHFLADPAGPEVIHIDEELLIYAKIALDSVREKTLSSDEQDYPCTCGGFCERDFTGA